MASVVRQLGAAKDPFGPTYRPLDRPSTTDLLEVVHVSRHQASLGAGADGLGAAAASEAASGVEGASSVVATVAGLSMAVLLLIIVASLTVVVGAIYLLIYFKSIKPMSARSRSYIEQGGKAHQDDDGGRGRSAHPFFRRS